MLQLLTPILPIDQLSRADRLHCSQLKDRRRYSCHPDCLDLLRLSRFVTITARPSKGAKSRQPDSAAGTAIISQPYPNLAMRRQSRTRDPSSADG